MKQQRKWPDPQVVKAATTTLAKENFLVRISPRRWTSGTDEATTKKMKTHDEDAGGEGLFPTQAERVGGVALNDIGREH